MSPDALTLLVAVLVAAAAGAVLALLLGRAASRARLTTLEQALADAQRRASEATTALAHRDAALTDLRVELATVAAREESQRERAGAAEVARTALERALAEEREAVAGLRADLAERLARAEAQAAAVERQLHDQRTFLDEARERLAEQFKAASQEVLQANTAYLTDRATQALGVEHERIVAQLRPVSDSMTKLEQLVTRVDKDREASGERLAEQLSAITRSHRELSDETRKLVTALRNPKARGTWGEMQLRRVVEFAGMLEHCDFEEQVNTVTDGQLQRPDLVVRLPGDKCVVVDAKAPLGAYLDAIEATQDEARDVALARHATQLRAHVKSLAGKAYWSTFDESADLVVLFVPGEAFLQAALVADPSLLDDALHANVMLASPVTLVALLKCAAYGWQQERLARNAEAIGREAAELVKRVGKLAEHFDAIGTGLRKAARAYNDMQGSFVRRVEPQGRRLEELGIAFDDRLEAPAPVDTSLLGSGAEAEPARTGAVVPPADR